ncbi:MAG: hypothetical protein AAB642_02030 [Patescibacteria group bacterium]
MEKEKAVEERGEVVVLSNQYTIHSPEAFRAIMAFQYGEAEESDIAFEKLKELAGRPDSNFKDAGRADEETQT